MKILSLAFLLFLSSEIWARPQYAVRRKLVNCMSCHFNPAGGGPRNIFGKSVAFRSHKPGVFSKQDLVSVDYRAVSINTAKAKNENPNGEGIMTSTVSGAVPVVQNDDGSDIHAIATYDFGGFAPKARETYARFTGTSEGVLTVGRFNIPFGLVTDEHRTYIRKMTKTDLNMFEMGMMYSDTPVGGLHYDLAVVNGYQNAGGLPDAGNNYGVVANIRTNFNSSPVMLGLSGLYNKGQINPTTGQIRENDPWALSVYGGFSLEKLVPGSFVAEVSYAHNFNRPEYNPNLGYFINAVESPTYYAEVQDKHAVGLMSRIDINFTQKWTLFYKVDAFAPDQEHMKDIFLLNSLGMRHWYSSNVDIDFRYEHAEIRREGLEDTGTRAGMSKFLILGRIWI